MKRYHFMLVNGPAELHGISFETAQEARVGDVLTLSGGPDETSVAFDIAAIDETDADETIVWVSPRKPVAEKP